jgi:PKD domain
MKVSFWIVLLCVVLFTFGSGIGKTESEKDKKDAKPKLVLDAKPRQGLSPHHASMSARLEGVGDTDQDWYCLKQEWDFGDGSISAEEPQCEPYTAETKILKEFYSDHTYDDPGKYPVRFKLGEDKLRSNIVTVVVIEGSYPQ